MKYTYHKMQPAEEVTSFKEVGSRFNAGEWIINGNLSLTAYHEPANREAYASVRPIISGDLEKGFLVLGDQRKLTAAEMKTATLYTKGIR